MNYTQKAISEALDEFGAIQRRIDSWENNLASEVAGVLLEEMSKQGLISERKRVEAHAMGMAMASDMLAEFTRRLCAAGKVKSIESTALADALTPELSARWIDTVRKSIASQRHKRSREADERKGVVRANTAPRDGGYVSFPSQEVFTGNTGSVSQPVASPPQMPVEYNAAPREKHVDLDGNDITPSYHKRDYPAKRGKR